MIVISILSIAVLRVLYSDEVSWTIRKMYPTLSDGFSRSIRLGPRFNSTLHRCWWQFSDVVDKLALCVTCIHHSWEITHRYLNYVINIQIVTNIKSVTRLENIGIIFLFLISKCQFYPKWLIIFTWSSLELEACSILNFDLQFNRISNEVRVFVFCEFVNSWNIIHGPITDKEYQMTHLYDYCNMILFGGCISNWCKLVSALMSHNRFFYDS